MRWTVVGEMKEMDCGLKEIKMKHDQWSVDYRKWDETWTMKCGLTELRWNMNNEVWTEGNKVKHAQWSVDWWNWDET